MSAYLARHSPGPAHTLDEQRPAIPPAAGASPAAADAPAGGTAARRTGSINYVKDGH
jgi:hypothetical protein